FTTIQTAGDAIQPFLPFFSQVTDIVKSLLQTNESAKCNQKICLALIDRVEIAQQAVNSLQRQQLANEKLFRDQDYYYAWVRFITVLENIRKFAKEVTQLSSLQKYISAMTVKEAFDKNIKEFEDNMGDISSDIRLVMKELTQLSTNIGELTKQIVKPESGSMGTEDTAKVKLNNVFKAPNINPADLEPYPISKESGKNIIKRVYRGVEYLYDNYVPKGTSPKVCPKGEGDDIPGFDLTATINNNQRSKNDNRESTYLPED
ncbi:13447_t:CDS:2, partial [Racocetra fulgida]